MSAPYLDNFIFEYSTAEEMILYHVLTGASHVLFFEGSRAIALMILLHSQNCMLHKNMKIIVTSAIIRNVGGGSVITLCISSTVFGVLCLSTVT